MLIVTVHIPGIAEPQVVRAETREAGLSDALYALGLHFAPEGTTVESQTVEDVQCSFAT
ncbi:hypothetical protein NB717_000077 [Xanthomonas sacchari]|uniref:hypothetical protein n=1 Tax=Xanthomonas sacchari TaxID=56458 RepID=UPI002253F5D6|nr:hypothetical protein [Xanthomonas sacchari]MCW0447222.1 hypothetical protein [Xanthomonas sacchari]MCW0459009.1 hypothetical protein [Xanthomonas sacchari]